MRFSVSLVHLLIYCDFVIGAFYIFIASIFKSIYLFIVFMLLVKLDELILIRVAWLHFLFSCLFMFLILI